MIVTNYPLDHTSFTGGVETSTAALLEGLAAYVEEFEFHVISLSTAIPYDVEEMHRGVVFHFLGGLHRRWLRPRLPIRIAKLHGLLKCLRPDLVHCQANPEFVLAALLAGCRPILTIHGVAAHEARLRTGWEFWSTHVYALVGRLVAPYIRAYICNSEYVTRTIRSKGRVFAIPNAVGSTFIDGPPPSEHAARPPYLVFIGVLAPLKRPADLVLAHAQLRSQFPELQTVLCGPTEDAAYAARVRRLLRNQGVEGVTFLGIVDQQRVAALLRDATAVVLPSAQENAPMAVAEAMAVGVPVVATRVGGVPEMVEHGITGMLYEPGNIPALVGCLEQLLRHPELGRTIGQKARARALQRYTPGAVASQTVRAYRALLDSHVTIAALPTTRS